MTDDFFPDAPVSLGAQIKCVERELRLRNRVYGRRVKAGTMTQKEADKETKCMEAVLMTLRGLRGPHLPDL